MKVEIAVLALVAAISSGAVLAEKDDTTGSSLLHNCQVMLEPKDLADAGRADTFGAGVCMGVVSGVLKTLVSVSDIGKISLICPPEGSFITNGQAIRITVKYLTEHPEELHMDQAALVMIALATAFPCK
jgi:hypothetical protein